MPSHIPAGGLDSNFTNSNNLSNRKRGLWIYVVFPPKEEKSKEELLLLLLHEATCVSAAVAATAAADITD